MIIFIVTFIFVELLHPDFRVTEHQKTLRMFLTHFQHTKGLQDTQQLLRFKLLVLHFILTLTSSLPEGTCLLVGLFIICVVFRRQCDHCVRQRYHCNELFDIGISGYSAVGDENTAPQGWSGSPTVQHCYFRHFQHQYTIKQHYVVSTLCCINIMSHQHSDPSTFRHVIKKTQADFWEPESGDNKFFVIRHFITK